MSVFINLHFGNHALGIALVCLICLLDGAIISIENEKKVKTFTNVWSRIQQI